LAGDLGDHPFLSCGNRLPEQAAQPLRWWRLYASAPQVSIGSDLEGFGVRIWRHDMFHQRGKEVDFILSMKELEAEVLPNLSALMTLRSFVPFFLPKRLCQRAGLIRQVPHNTSGDILATSWETTVELKRLEQDGKPKPGGAGLVGQQTALFSRERPVSIEFFGMPVLSHEQKRNRLWLSVPEQNIQAQLVIALGKDGLDQTLSTLVPENFQTLFGS
jgi:hypothetical protein